MTRIQPLLFATAAVALTLAALPAQAQVQTTQQVVNIETREDVVVPPGVTAFRIEDFDLNGDGALVSQEVGDKLFKMYDVDGNGVVDNLEYARKAIATLQPVERTTTISYDMTGNGSVDKQETSHERFLRETQLSRFDKNNKGLSAQELLDRNFREADINDDKFISIKEWRGAYNAAIDRSNKIQGNLNR